MGHLTVYPGNIAGNLTKIFQKSQMPWGLPGGGGMGGFGIDRYIKPKGGTTGICEAFDLYCLPHPQEFDLESGSLGGEVCFFCTEEWNQVTASHVLFCAPAILMGKRLNG